MFFFFGTLMDLDVLARVIGRPVDPAELTVAEIDDYRRVRAVHEPYPVLVPAPGTTVEGRLMRPRSAWEAARVAWFEEGEYAERRWRVRTHDGGTVAARIFFGLPVLGATPEAWELDAWTRTEKASFLERCDGWLRDCPI